MGKLKPRILGDEEIEKKQKDESKKKADAKKVSKKAVEPQTDAVENQTESEKENTGKKQTAKKTVVKKDRGEKYQKVKKLVDSTKKYTVEDAVALLKKMKYAGFDESVEIHLNVEKTGLKGEVELPHSTGKTVKVAIVDDAVLEALEKGTIHFDILITHPSFMPRLAKFAKVLGPKGLMPNPKAGTISPNPEEVAKKFLKGTLRWKTESKFPLIHQMLGKLSYDDKQLVENIKAFIEAVGKVHIFGAYITSTMTPSVKIDLEKI